MPVQETNNAGRLPDFIVIGAMKAATTSLWKYLRAHPQVFMPELKEMQFFSNPGRLRRDLQWYREQFAPAGAAISVGEASTNYTKYPRLLGTSERMAAAVPDVRLVYLVRDPIERIRSHYLHVAYGHSEHRPLVEAVREDPEYVSISRYRMQIDQYLEHFDASQLLVVTSEALKANRKRTMDQVFRFVGVDPVLTVPEREREVHRTADKRVDTPAMTRLRRSPIAESLRRFTPATLRRLASRTVTRPVTTQVDATITDELRRQLVDELADDVAGLRPFLGADFDGGGIA
jgi:hypothetical protein